MQYDWDPAKAARNLAKHRVSFDEAVTVFDDPNIVMRDDTARGEARLDVLGWSAHARLLYVVCVEVTDNIVRIISARRATKAERDQYDAA